MSEEPTPEERKALEELTEAVASELAEGKSKEFMVKGLVKQDWPGESAVEFVPS